MDQADDPAITDPVFDESDQPFSAKRIEERLDIGVKDPVDFARLDPVRERVQGIVLSVPGSEPVTKSQELRLVDRREDRHHRCLDDLVLQGSDAERPLSAIGLRNKLPPRRLRSIRSCVNARVQISEVSVKVCRVLFPGQTVDPRCGVLLQSEESPAQTVEADMVQECCQLLPFVPVNGFAYASLRL